MMEGVLVASPSSTPSFASLDLAQRIGAWAARFEPSDPRIARIKASIRDFVGCVAAGTRQPELRSAMALAPRGAVPVWGTTDSFDPAGAALVSGTAGALLQLHDVYPPGSSHPSAPIIAAAWSTLQSRGTVSSTEFVHAVAAGYEVANRLSKACVPAQLMAGSSPTGTAGSLGAAVAAAKLQGLDAAGIGRAVCNAALLLPATPFAAMRAHGALVPLHSGLAARCGYEAAVLARAGDAGHRVLEGDREGPGLLGLLRCDPAAIEPELWDGATIDAVAWKFFPACLATHVALEAALSLGRVDVSRIDRVVLCRPGGPLEGMVANGPGDGCLYDRLMSIRWVVARALQLGRCDYPDAIENAPDTLELAKKIELRDEAPPSPGAAPGDWVAIEIYASGKMAERLDYTRQARRTAESPGPPCGSSSDLDETALRNKFDRMMAAAPVAASQLTRAGVD